MRSLNPQVLALLGAAALALPSSPATAAQAQPTQAEKASSAAYAQAKKSPGYAVYVAKGCYECHGYSGGGAMPTGLPLAPNPLSVDQIRAYVRAPRGQMPPYSAAILSDQDIGLIHDYLAAIPAPRAPADIPLLAPLLNGPGR